MRKIPFSIQIILAMGLGLFVGLTFGKPVAPLGELGKLIIQLVKVAAIPLLFLAIVNTILKSEVKLRSGLRMIVIATINATIALCIGLGISNFFQPGKHLQLSEISPAAGASAMIRAEKIDFLKTVSGYVPTSIVQPFNENLVITIVLMALLLGFGIRRVRSQQAKVQQQNFVLDEILEELLSTVEVILKWVIRLIPIAVFGVVAKATGEYGLAPLKGLGVYVAVGLLGLFLHVAITYSFLIRFVAGIPLRTFWKQAREPVVYAMGANSSLATLPITLKALDNLKVSRASSALGACVGTNFNNDGIILYEAMAVLLLAQAHGIDMSLGQQVLAAIACMVAAMGIAGVPEAGFVSLSLVLATVGLPLELLPLLLTVDWIIARGRSVVNVLSDMVVSILIDRWEGATRKGVAVARA
jgi:Na+/H+-dicarboxylate symporter